MARDPKTIAARQGQADAFLTNGVQIDMFGEDGKSIPPSERQAKGLGGRPAGAKNKLKQKVAEYMAARGFRDPVDQLAMIAGLDRPDLHPMAYAAMIAEQLGEDTADVLKVMRQAASDILPYFHPKVTPEVQINADQMNVLVAAPGVGQVQSRRVGPPPLPEKESVEKQEVSNPSDSGNDGEARTE